ncbi:uncharacterized protein LOC130929649 isoform X2 [Corythoichthys intestinalis]|nr:uncharacterized protein LOC130929649 isoform X2 [Corythoichthys intestinalis]
MDLHKKGVFNLPVSDIKEASEDFTGEVDIEHFWDNVQLEMISYGFTPTHAKNPFGVKPNFEYWAPWIGKNTRKSEVVLNTEYEKLSASKSSAETEVSMVSEDRLVDELMKQKVSTVRKLCKACNLDCRGSRMDLIIRLREEMKTRHSYDKIFQKIWGASGGWSVILCPHAVVYSLKFNLRAESPRDFTDLLLSWKHLPNVSVYDFARGLTTHANLRLPNALPFRPHEGRLAASLSDNISKAQQKKLKISLPWLTEKSQTPQKHGHPLTGSSDHYVLYDKFHETNTKDPQEILRRIDLVPELQGSLNSQVAEQLFASMQKNNYFLNNMAPSTHIFLMRNIIHHRNNTTNARLLEKQLQRGLDSHHLSDITLNDFGQAVFAPRPQSHSEELKSQPPNDSHPLHIQGCNTDTSGNNEQCGTHCAVITNCESIRPCRASWAVKTHPAQERLLAYILDIERPETELIVQTNKACLTRSDFWTLGLNREMESTIGNACLELVQRIAHSKVRKSIFLESKGIILTVQHVCMHVWAHIGVCVCLYVYIVCQCVIYDVFLRERTYLWPTSMLSRHGVSLQNVTHSCICLLTSKTEMLSLFPFGNLDTSCYLNLCQSINAGTWTEIIGTDIQGFPGQPYGNDCGIFMLMYALYGVLDAPFDFNITDMPTLRKWWCILLVENFELGCHGKLFAHWTNEAKALLQGEVPPVFRLKKRKYDTIAEGVQDKEMWTREMI